MFRKVFPIFTKSYVLKSSVILKIRLARKMIAKFCQKDKVTPNQDRINPSNAASKNSPATAITMTPKTKPRAVEDFMD